MNYLLGTMETARIDDEHNLIARYAAKLNAHEVTHCNGNTHTASVVNDTTQSNTSAGTDYKLHQSLIAELEASNRQIMEDITQLRMAKDAASTNSSLVFELQMLKEHKGELESRMNQLQGGRQDLMEQLEQLMALLKSRDAKLASPSRSPRQKQAPVTSLAQHGSPRSIQNGRTLPADLVLSSSKTKRQFTELFTAADAINDALAHLVDQVTDISEEEISTTSRLDSMGFTFDSCGESHGGVSYR